MKNKKTLKKSNVDIFILVLSPLLSAALAWTLNLNFLVSTILFFGVPAAYLSLKDPEKVRRVLIFVGCFSVAGVYTDYMAEKDLAWVEPHSLFSLRVGGLVPIESLVWFFLLSYLVLIFYEHFFDHASHRSTGRRMKLLYWILVVSSAAFILPLLLNKQLPTVSYFYLKLGIILGLIPLLTFVVEAPRFIKIFLRTAPYFLMLCLLNELVGLHNGHWLFPGQHFIGWIHLGSFHFPMEELLFWMLMFSSIVIAYFEFFDDNRLKFKPIRAKR